MNQSLPDHIARLVNCTKDFTLAGEFGRSLRFQIDDLTSMPQREICFIPVLIQFIVLVLFLFVVRDNIYTQTHTNRRQRQRRLRRRERESTRLDIHTYTHTHIHCLLDLLVLTCLTCLSVVIQKKLCFSIHTYI